MSQLNRIKVLDMMIKHETLTIGDTGVRENIGFSPNKEHLKSLLDELTNEGHMTLLNGVMPLTYTITDKGIAEKKRLDEE